MNRNSNSRFSIAPQVDIQRSTFDRSSGVKTSFNVGELVPFFVEEVLPGDTFKVKTSKVARMQTLKTPMMDDIFLDTYYFFVPNRLVWNHWKEFMGENTQSAWIPQNEYTIPQITSPEGGWNVGTIADYLGIPPGVDNISVNALPFRAYALCCNEWYRDENLSDPLNIELGDSTVAGSNGSTFVDDVAKGGVPYLAAKTHDYFTSCLPAPQKGPEVQINSLSGPSLLPVYTTGFPNEHFNYAPTASGLTAYDAAVKASYPLMFENAYTYQPNGTNVAWPKIISGTNNTAGASYTLRGLQTPDAESSNNFSLQSFIRDQQDTPVAHSVLNMTLNQIHNAQSPSIEALTPVNLVAESSGKYLFTSINDLRQAFQVQRFYEKSARGGTRYIEIIKSHFGVTSPDARMQRPEYLGGNRLPLNVRQITQTSATEVNSPMGDVAGMSVTNDTHFDFDKSFTEHGYIIGICVARYHHTYQQGIERTFNRKTKFDFYWPVFAHLGEQAVLNKEIYAQGYDSDSDVVDVDSQVFGFQERYAEYRYKPNRISGMMRSVANTALDTWHLADDYDSLPYLSDSWIREDKNNVDRVLSVTSAVSDQIFADILISEKATRPMPLYSIPGLIDHF